MKKNLFTIFRTACLVLLCLSIFSSCKDTFDLSPEEVLESSQMYRNVYDADAAVLGIYGKFVGLADRYVLLNELRGDLLDVTPNANTYLRQLGNHNVVEENPYTDPRPFYEVIVNCNDVLKNFDIMRDKNLLDRNQYYQRYTDILFLRSWIYLQLGIQYGTVPYVTQALEDVNDLKDESKFPKMAFKELLAKLIESTEATPREYLDQNTASSSPTLITPINTYPIKDGVFKFFVHRRSLLGDLHLWNGDYLAAASYYKDVMETATNLTGNTSQTIDVFDTYRVADDNSPDHSLKTTAVINPWYKIFSAPLAEKIPNWERMWTLPLDKSYAPRNPFIDLFSVSGSYLVKPSVVSINNWDNQVRTDGGLTDRRGLGSSYTIDAGQPEVLKYVQNYDVLTPFEVTGIWTIYRAAILHLRYAEAANRLGRSELAGALINDGITAVFGTKSTYDGVVESYPFNFDGTNSSSFRGDWYRNKGIRGRGVNQNVTFDAANLTIDTENKIIEEEALETAYEGYRWQDLLRIALRREANGENGKKFLRDKIAAKFEKAGVTVPAGVQQLELDTKSWYLPFRWK